MRYENLILTVIHFYVILFIEVVVCEHCGDMCEDIQCTCILYLCLKFEITL